MSEKRRTNRVQIDDFGRIISAGCHDLPCRVRDRSETGLRLAVHHEWAVPARFTLEILKTKERVDVEVAWREASEVGVMFATRGSVSAEAA